MSRKAMEDEEKRVNNTLTEWTVEKFLDMRKELLDRQKDLEKSNLEMVEKVENLSNELQEKMDKIVETLHPEASSEVVEKVRLSDERIEKLSNDLQLKMDEIIETLKPESSSETVEKIRLCDDKIEKLSKELQSKLNQIDETLKTEVSSEIVEKIRLSDEKIEKLSKKFNSIQSKLNKVVETLKPETMSGIEQMIRLSDEQTEKLLNALQSKMDQTIMTLKQEASSKMIEKIRLCDEKTENLSKKFDSLKPEISLKIEKLSKEHQLKLDKIVESLKPVVSSEIQKLSKEHEEKFDSIQWKLNQIVETLRPEALSKIVENTNSATSGKYFVLKHTFNNVSSFKDKEICYSEEEEHFGVPWRMYVRRSYGFLNFYLENILRKNTEKKWEIEVEYEMKIVSPSSREWKEKIRKKATEVFRSDGKGGTCRYSDIKFMEWNELKKDFVVDDCFCAEIAVKVKKMTGIYKENLRRFDKTMEEYSDVVLIVNNEKFYVLKLILANDSPYFKNLFSGISNETEKTEIQLSGIDSDDFQNYLEVVYGKQAIDEFTVEGILMVAYKYETPEVIEKCEKFLRRESKKKLKTKLRLCNRYNLPALMKQCFD